MKDMDKENVEKRPGNRIEMKARLENVLSPLHKDRNDGGSSSSLDSKDSKGGGKLNGVPLVLEDHEKSWFRNSAKCELEQLKKLYEKDSELLNKKDYFTGYAAVHWAAKKGRCDIIAWLYQKKGETNLRTSGGYTPLHLATIHKRETTIHKLINQFEADINLRDYSGKKPRHYLSKDLSASVTRALQETPSVIELKVDPNSELVSIEGFATPTAIRKSLRNPLVKAQTFDRAFDEEPTGGLRRIRKKGLAISNSFKMKKRSHYIMKRESSICESPPLERSPSVPDIVLFSEMENRRKSIVDYAALVTTPTDELPLVHEAIIPRTRKHSVSDMLINGYAGLIKENKHHRKPSPAENKDYSINTWI